MKPNTLSKIKELCISEGKRIQVDRCYRLLIHDPNSVIYIEEGIIDLFAVHYPDTFTDEQKKYLDEQALETSPFLAELIEGSLTFIGSREADQMLFPFPLTELNGSWRILGIIAEPTKIYKLPFLRLEQLARIDSAVKDEVGESLKQWIEALSKSSLNRVSTGDVRLLNLKETVTFSPSEIITKRRINTDASKNEIVWVKILSGSLTYISDLESKNIPITKEDPPFPLYYNLNVMAIEHGSAYGHSTEEIIELGELRRSLLFFHNVFLTTVYLHVLQKEAEDVKRAISQAELENYQLQRTYNQIRDIVAEKEGVVLTPTRNQLFNALRIIGENIDSTFLYPPEEDPAKSIESRIDYFCVFSKISYRRVFLDKGWWKSTEGSLLGLKTDGSPVALVKDKKDNYVQIDPQTHQHTAMDEVLAGSIQPDAYIFYPNLHAKYPVTFSEMLRFTLRKQLRAIRSIFFLSFIAIGLAQFIPFATKILFDYLIPNLEKEFLPEVFLGLFIANLGITMFKLVEEYTVARLITISEINGNAAVCDRLLSLPIQFFRTFQIGSLLQRVIGWTTIMNAITGQPIRVILNGVFSILYLVSMIIYSPQLAFTGVCVLLVFVLLSTGFLIKNIELGYQILELKGIWSSKVIEIIEAISKIKTSGLEKRMFVVWEELYIKYKLLEKKMGNNTSIFKTLLAGNNNLSLFSFFFLIIYFLVYPNEGSLSHLTIGDFAAFMAAYGPFSQATIGLLTASISLLNLKPSWDRCKILFAEKPELDSSKQRVLNMNGAIKVEHVSFKYNPDGPLILRDVSIEAKPGDLIGIVGISGSGKSTLLRLLLGLEKSETGAIFFDHKNVQDLDLEDLRSHFGVVLQDSMILSGTLKEIITGRRFYTNEQILKAVHMAGLSEDLAKLPMGLETVVLNGAFTFSGGQRQRIMLARALIGNPKILFLDEATSALDNKTEQVIKENIDRMDVTRIVVAHRLGTVKEADCIYVMQDGVIIQKGRYEELAAVEGLFKELIDKEKI
jgi:NHLM bacteriocin system ABC transporter ATP-binding protein